MKINEVMKETGLTKKSIYYYENEGLISPKKDPWNNYRIYDDEDVRKLIQINILRRLDVPIKSISDIINHEIAVKEILKEQLILTNLKINNLYHNKMIMNELIVKDIDDKDFSPDTLKEYNLKLNEIMTGSGDLAREIVRMFPGILGKLMAIFYSNFLDVPLDTDDKICAWRELIKKLDDMSEVEYPEDIKQIVDKLYDDMERDRLDFPGDISSRNDNCVKPHSSPILKESMAQYSLNLDNQKKIEGYYELQNFILNCLTEFKEVGFYIGIINESYRCKDMRQ